MLCSSCICLVYVAADTIYINIYYLNLASLPSVIWAARRFCALTVNQTTFGIAATTRYILAYTTTCFHSYRVHILILFLLFFLPSLLHSFLCLFSY